jgi:mannose-6-phosphate isomerase-like protein (cupin superfamily)
MAIALTPETSVSCPSESGYTTPFATLEMIESPDSGPRPMAAQSQLETIFQVLDGVVYVVADEDEWALTPGDIARIPGGVPYKRWNAGETEARWVEVYCGA